MKNFSKFFLPFTIISLGVVYLLRKKQAGTGLRYEPLSVSLDTKKSSLSQLYFDIKIKIINNQNTELTVNQILFDVFIKGKRIGQVVKNDIISIPAIGSQNVSIGTNFSTLNLGLTIINLIREAIEDKNVIIPVTIEGFIIADGFRLPVNYQQEINFDLPKFKKKTKEPV